MAVILAPLLGSLAIPFVALVKVDKFVSGRFETAAGLAPVVPGGPSEPSVSDELRTTLGLRLEGERYQVFVAAGPRLLLKVPNFSSYQRPLVLWQTLANLQYSLKPNLSWTTQAQATIGEVNYESASTALLNNAARGVTLPVFTSVAAEGRTGLAWQMSMRRSLAVSVMGGYLSGLDTPSRRTLDSTVTLGADVTPRWELDTRSSFALWTTERSYLIQKQPNAHTLGILPSYRRQFDLRTTFNASLGVTGVAESDGTMVIQPSGLLSLERVLHEEAASRVSNLLELSLQTRFDPTLGQALPTLGLRSTATSDLTYRWSLVAGVEAYTTATLHPTGPTVPGDAGAAQTDDSVGAARILARYRVSRWFTFEFGVRGWTRATHWNAPEFHLVDRTVWGFLAVTGTTDTFRGTRL